MPINHAVLGLLVQGPSYGYELRASFERAIGPQWGKLNIGHLYQVLERLTRDGFVTKRTQHQEDRPDRVVYRLTVGGRRELERWLGEPWAHAGYRDDFFLKLFVASRTGTESVREVVRIQREGCLQELAALGRLRRQAGTDPLVRVLLEAAVLHTKANLRVADLAEESAPALETAARSAAGPSAPAAQPESTDLGMDSRGA